MQWDSGKLASVTRVARRNWPVATKCAKGQGRVGGTALQWRSGLNMHSGTGMQVFMRQLIIHTERITGRVAHDRQVDVPGGAVPSLRSHCPVIGRDGQHSASLRNSCGCTLVARRASGTLVLIRFAIH